MQDKVSEKAIWEGSIPSEDENTQFASSMQFQPQMMFCYKCNNVIPGDSTYCPYCQVKLYTECPKCGSKYSSQYPACKQCGTNRLEYLLAQRREQERIEAKKCEDKLRQQRIELERLEKERIIENQKREAQEKAKMERLKLQQSIIRENDFIQATQEFREAYAYLCELIERKKIYNKKQYKFLFNSLKILGVLWPIGLIFYNSLPESIATIVLLSPFIPLLLFIYIEGKKTIHNIQDLQRHCPQTRDFDNQLIQGIIDGASEYVARRDIDLNNCFSKEHFVEECIKAYKAAGGSVPTNNIR